MFQIFRLTVFRAFDEQEKEFFSSNTANIFIIRIFNNSWKLILKKFNKYFFMKITTGTLQVPMYNPKLITQNFSRWKETHSKALSFPENTTALVFFQQKCWAYSWRSSFSKKGVKQFLQHCGHQIYALKGCAKAIAE